MSKLIAAYTPATSPYPPYVNITRHQDGGVTLTVREPPGPGEFSALDCGRTVSYPMPPEAWDEIKAQIAERDQ